MGPRQSSGNEHDDPRTAVFREIGETYARAVLGGDEVAAELAIRDAIDAKLTTAEIDDEIIAPALWLVGRLWERGDITVADEHLATEISIRVLALQREARRTVTARGGSRAMLAAPQGEQHVVALRMGGNLLREAGYDVLMLGADVPPHDLAASVVTHKPDLICMSATLAGAGDRVLLAMHELQGVWPEARFVVGGSGVSSRLRGRPGVEICARVSDIVEAADALIKRAQFN